ncbi:MAG TPA: bifunctional GTP diphosphokinase/guanosine-3',5'-bis pyrophosphate 3'-pyrophosphohydrolase [Gammaproteobacteria bacterium]|nr:bifunctional GTP diphosphokinase/guanosine-3',5'-bis pyrophosphate 3'-pyrophosphohydrolase [Gammaproteobacteria bacterium]
MSRPQAQPEADNGGHVFLISDLCAMLETYLEPDQVAEVYRAYLFGAEAHEGQRRATGEPYIYHPIAAARILAEMHMDYKSLMAAILHDVIEDTPTAREQLVETFGEDVAALVDGVSKLSHIHFESRAEEQAENFRKMILAMTQDIRVILVKLADRTHNMRTLKGLRPDKRRRIARETLDIYAPIAQRLGMNSIRLELEDLGFQALYPMRYRILKQAVRKARGNRKEIVSKIEEAMAERLRQEGLEAEVIGREKHLFSIYQKMRDKGLSFNEVMDVFAVRIIVDSVDQCYRVLGAVHNLYKPVPGKFKDYIAIPKSNGYQSLHTILFSPYNVYVEVQIRTRDMHRVAEAGIAAHWLYKSGDEHGNSAQVRAREWLKGLLEIQQHAGNSIEFLENVKVDLFPEEVYVFTPGGDIFELPRGSTAVDLAYAIHTDIGNQCVAAKIDRQLMPLRTPLYNGQTVEIITSPGAQPNPAWLDFVVTGKARSNIRHFLKNLRQEESIALGRRLLNKALVAWEIKLDAIPRKDINRVVKGYKYRDLDELLAEIGLGNQVAIVVARALLEGSRKIRDEEGEDSTSPLAIRGTEGAVVQLARCCHPIPDDPIVGFISAGRGIVIHHRDCKNVADFRSRPEKWVDVEWEPDADKDYPVDVRLLTANKRGVLATIAAAVSEMDANIENVNMEERDGMFTSLNLTITVKNRKHLARIIRRLRSYDMVERIQRIK